MQTASTGMGLPTVLTIVFVVLKLTEVIDWSWWWVFSPLLFGAGIGVLVLVAVLVGIGLASSLGNNTPRWR